MIPLLPFKTSKQLTRKYYRLTQLAGLVPVAVILGLMSAHPRTVTPGLASALGIILGLEFILTGAYRLHNERGQLTSFGRRLAEHPDTWFPLLLFVIQNAFLITILVVLWYVVQDLGLYVLPIQNVTLIMVFLLVPFRRALEAIGSVRGDPRPQEASEALLPILVGAVALFVSTSLTSWLSKAYQEIPTQSGDLHSPPILFIWVTTILVLMTCLVIFFARLRRVFRTEPEA